MERALTYEEKIRRAEEIYARRNKNNIGNITRVNIRENKKKSVLKKMLIQMLICLTMYSILYLNNKTNYIFSEDIKNNTEQILSYDIDLIKTYENISESLKKFINETEETEETEEQIPNNNNQEEMKEDIQNINQQENIENEEVVQDIKEETKNISQMEIDANEIKQNYSIISPLTGIVSSEFGEREVNNPLITSEHYGIDLAADEGAGIVAAMEGEVVTATVSPSYRKLYKNSK